MTSHLVDPDGDVDLLLLEELALQLDGEIQVPPSAPSLSYKRPPTPVFTTTVSTTSKKNKKKSKIGSLLALESFTLEPESAPVVEHLTLGENNDADQNQELSSTEPIEDCLALEVDEALIRIRVSSKHLMLVSPYFKRTLQSGLVESCTFQAHGHVELNMKDQDPEAMLIVMNAIHGRSRQVPSSVNINMLTKIATLVDYIQSHEVIEPFSDKWIKKMQNSIPTTYCRDLVHWLCISYVFDKARIFKTVTQTAIRQATGPVVEIGLPIWDFVSDKLNQKRSATIERLLCGLETLLESLRLDQNECSFNCNAIQYGTLAKELGYRGLLFPRPQSPFLGYSFDNIVTSLRQIPNSRGCDRCAESPYDRSTGNLIPRITAAINDTAEYLEGLSLGDFR